MWINLLFILLLGCSQTKEQNHPLNLVIEQNNPSKLTELTKQNILQLAQVYDLEPLLFSKKIIIESGMVNQSKPTIILNTKNAESPKKLLASLIHEQMDWWLESQSTRTKQLIKQMKVLYPTPPKTTRYGKDSTLKLLIICYLEYKALIHLLGLKDATSVLKELMTKDRVFPWVYNEVFKNGEKIRKAIKRNDLFPKVLL